jgi:hypothetical protein
VNTKSTGNKSNRQMGLNPTKSCLHWTGDKRRRRQPIQGEKIHIRQTSGNGWTSSQKLKKSD